MKKYKLIKTYPGSPELGTEVIKNGTGYDRLDKSKPLKNWVIPVNIEDYSEFWQEIIEKEFEILSFGCNTSIYHLIDGFYTNGVLANYSLQAMLSYLTANHNPSYIHSIKRLSDGEVFTVGDKIDLSKYEFAFPKSDTLLEIKIIDNEIRFKMNFQEKHNWDSYYTLHYIQKLKQSLFKTEDGVDIYEGDTYYKVVNESFQLLIMERASKGESLRSKVFSTKEKAEEYILLNKPCLSYNDLTDPSLELGIRHKNKIKEIIKNKLKIISGKK